MQRNFCSILSAASTDNLFASAPVFTRLLLLEYNFAWGENPLEENRIGDKIMLFLSNCIEQNIFSRIMFIKNNSSPAGEINMFVASCRDEMPFMKRFVLHDYEEIMKFNFEACFSEPGRDIFKHPLYLVCTHGKVDMCCSKFGLPIFKKMSELDKNTWQCTHVTGDRFAPNIVQLPYAHYYGRLQLNEMDDFYDTLKKDDIFMSRYRGRPCHSKGEQAAEFFLRKATDDWHYDTIKFINTEVLTDRDMITTFRHDPSATQYAVRYTVEKSEDKYFLNCQADEAVSVDQHKLSYIVKV